MNRAIVTICFLLLASSGPLTAGTTETFFVQGPILSDAGFFDAVPADKTCNVACSPTQSRAYAVALPGTDMLPLSFRINEIEVWGIYKAGVLDPGTPPTEDSFTVRVHGPDPGSYYTLPGEAVCSHSELVGTRVIVDNIRGFDVYLHTLQLPAPCVVYVPANLVFWIEVFNDTGSSDDWFWFAGTPSFWWPPDCCLDHSAYGTAVDLGHAPGDQWGPVFTPLALRSKITDVGETQNLRLSKLPNDELGLQWDGDCGGGGDYSVYRGSLASGYSSLAPEPGLCDVSGTSVTIPAGDDTADFFLVSPWVASCAGCPCDPADDNCRIQGSYGADSSGTARPQPSTYCYWQTSNQMHDCAP